MPVIKNYNATTLIKDAIVLDLGDLSRQAARIRVDAEAKASRIINEAEVEAARLSQNAAAEGFELGKAEGLAQGLKDGRAQGHADALAQASEQLQQIQQAWNNCLGQLEADREQLERDARQGVLTLALHLAEKLVHRIIEMDRSVVVDQIANALGHVLRPLDVTVRVCPEDHGLIDEALPDLLADFSQFDHVRIVDDPDVGAGGCVVTYGQGRIDATVEKQLERIIDLMLPADRKDEEPAVNHDTEYKLKTPAEPKDSQS